MTIADFCGQNINGEINFMFNDKVYLLGGAQTDFERNWAKEGKGVIALLREVLADALKNVNITYDEIQQLNDENQVACFVGNFIAEKYIDQGHLGALLTEVHPAFYGIPSARFEAACASGSAALDAAITKVRTGDCQLAIVVGFELMKNVDARTGGGFLGHAAFYETESKGIDFPFPNLFGRLADEFLKKYNLDEERFMNSLAQISAINYENGKRNPLAQTRKWFMSLEQAKNRGTETNMYVGGRLAVTDCSQITDGAAVVILASEAFAKRVKKETIIIKGFGHRVAPMRFEAKMRNAQHSEYILPWTRQAVLDAYKRAEMSIEDIDVFETHDCFTSSEYAAISAFGLTEPGREYEAIEDGRIRIDGEKPINPSGGLIGCGHPVGATGVRMMLDLFKQIAGEAGNYQVPGVQNGMMLNIGGSATTNFVFIVGKE